jgi:hypothetical protein
MESSLRDSVTRLALYDELEKIALASERGSKVKKFIGNTALVASGAAAGTGLYMLAERYGPKLLGPQWRSLTKQQKVAVLGPILTAGSIGVPILLKNMLKEKVRRMQ